MLFRSKRFVIDGYNQLLAAHEKKDFLKMTEAARNILSLVDDYRDTKSYERVAKQGLEQIEEEKRKRESEEKQRRIREEVAKLEDKGQAVFERALKESSARSELDAVIQEIYAKDPNNRKAAEWKQRVKDSIEDEKRQAEEAAKKEELRRKAEDAYAKVEAIFKQEKFLEALKEAEHLVDGSWNEKEYLDKVEKLKTDIRTGLKNVLDPLLTEAKNQRQEGGDLVKARDKYREVLAIDRKSTRLNSSH